MLTQLFNTHISTYTEDLISTVFLLYNWHMMKQTEGKLLLMRKITVAAVKLVQGRTHLDDFSSSVCHGQWTSVQSRGGREEEQLAHLVHTTATHTHHTVSYAETFTQMA